MLSIEYKVLKKIEDITQSLFNMCLMMFNLSSSPNRPPIKLRGPTKKKKKKKEKRKNTGIP
jgi:hypothetical protein